MILINPLGDNLEIGTRIHWDQDQQCCFYTDIPQSRIYKYKPSSGTITSAKVGTEPLAFAFPIEGSQDEFIAGLGRNIVFLKWDGVSDSVCSCNVIAEVDRQPENSNNRLNGAKVDPFGRLWAGTMGPQDGNGLTVPGKGSLYSLTQGKLKRHLSGIGISNGLAFNVELKKMYYIDTLFAGVYQFDYDGESGEINNQKIILRFDDHGISGSPDGLTIDRDGNLWLTSIFGSSIIKFDPRTGLVLNKIEMPTPQITALTFGNENLNVLYVTTAKIPQNGKVPGYPAGSTFKLENIGGSRGFPGGKYKVRV